MENTPDYQGFARFAAGYHQVGQSRFGLATCSTITTSLRARCAGAAKSASMCFERECCLEKLPREELQADGFLMHRVVDNKTFKAKTINVPQDNR